MINEHNALIQYARPRNRIIAVAASAQNISLNEWVSKVIYQAAL